MTPRYCETTEYACLEVRGADAGAFLQAQLTQAVDALLPGRAAISGWLDARGRVRALVRALKVGDRWLLVTARDGSDQLAQRLRMFILRAAVTIEAAGGLTVAAVLDAEPRWLEERGLPPQATSGVHVERGAQHWVAISATDWLLVGRAADLAPLGQALPAVEPAAAALAEIRLGWPLVTAAVADRFVAQMLNLDLLWALAFDKGCYPGQEVVARVHNLGDVKRRVRRYSTLGAAPAVGTSVLAADGTNVGEVLRSAPANAGAELLAIVEHTAADAALSIAGNTLRELPLPFAVPRG